MSIGGFFLFWIVTIAYIILFVYIGLKLAKRQTRKAEKFCEKADRDGRKVVAHLDSYSIDNSEPDHPYIGDYSYIAPNGKRYRMKGYHCVYNSTPPNERIIYLHPRNYRKYYLNIMNLGKHKTVFVLLFYLSAFIIYGLLMKHLIFPIIFINR